MNHDETNSKSDPKPEAPLGSDRAVEARVVAWVAGEASAFESAELERLLAEKPELAIFKRRIEAVHGLVGEAERPDREPLRMAAEQRAKLIQTIGVVEGVEAGATKDRPLPMSASGRRPKWTWRAPQIYFAASGLAAAGLIVLFVLPRDEGEYRMTAAVSRAEANQTALRRESTSRAAAEVRVSEISTIALPSSEAPSPVAPESPMPALRLEAFTVGRAALPEPKMSERQATVVADATAKRPAAKVAGAAGAGGRVGEEELRRIDQARASAPAPAEGIVKLDAFTVSASRDAGYAASGGARGAAVPFGEKPAPPPAPVFNERLRKNTAQRAAGLSDGRSITLGASPAGLSVQEAGTLAASAKQFSADEKKAKELVTFGFVGGNDGSNAAAKTVTEDRPLVRPAPADKDRDEALRTEVAASAQLESTFSLHVSDVSFRLAQAALARGELPEADRIRPEEFYNAFNYGDPVPTMVEKVGARIEQAAHPFLQQRNLVRIAVKVPSTGRSAAQPLRLTVLLDTSGSMEREDRVATVRRALQELIALLGPDDRVTLIGFARQPRLLAEAVPGHQAGWLVDLATRTPAEGGTNLEEALKLGGELARRQALPGAQNRIVVLTDGAANLGNADPDQLAKAVEVLRQQGIAFDACGIGLDGLDDAVLEALTRRGDGRYHVLNSPDDAGVGFARQLAGAFRPAAENVKLQVRFNAARVGRYRLIGFEQHRLRPEDFRNDRVDAAELAAEEAAVALYQVEVQPGGAGEIGEVAVRFRDAATGQRVERSWAIPYEPAAPAFDRASPSIQLAGTAALLAEKLRGGALAEPIRLRDLAPIVNALRGQYANEPRVQEFVAMFAQARRRVGD